MDKFQDVLLRAGNWASQNKYLGSIAKAFEAFMPFVIIGAVGVLWSNVLVNAETGLGALWSPIMGLAFLNPAFDALNFATIGCIGICITILLGQEIAERNGIDGKFGGILSLACLVTVVPTAQAVFDAEGNAASVSGLMSSILGSETMFTGMVIAIVAVELFTVLFKIDALKLKMPEQVPPGVSRSFEYLIPGGITMIIISVAGLLIKLGTGFYINELIFNAIQTPLQSVGGSLGGLLIFELVALLFWCVGLHGDNMISGVFQPIMFALSAENVAAVTAGKAAPHIVNFSFARIVYATGGTGLVIGLALAIFIVGKREENRAIAKLGFVPNLFNIMEVEFFGIPLVLNPVLLVPFIVAPIVCTLLGYFATVAGIIPVIYLNLPWTMPPFLYAFLGSGGNFMAGVFHLVLVAVATVIYMPFVKMYEKQQAQLAGEE